METTIEKEERVKKARKKLRDAVKENQKAHWLVRHIEEHLKEMKIDGKVLCKICNKDIDEIAEETMQLIETEIKSVF